MWTSSLMVGAALLVASTSLLLLGLAGLGRGRHSVGAVEGNLDDTVGATGSALVEPEALARSALALTEEGVQALQALRDRELRARLLASDGLLPALVLASLAVRVTIDVHLTPPLRGRLRLEGSAPTPCPRRGTGRGS